MPICACLSSLALRQLTVDRVDWLLRKVADHATDHSRRLLDVLEDCNRRAWESLEVVLSGRTFWNRFNRAETKSVRDQMGRFVDQIPPPQGYTPETFRAHCLKELRDARKKGVLLGKLVAGDLREQAGQFAALSDPQALLKAEKKALNQLAKDVHAGGFRFLGWLLAQPAQTGESVVVVAVRYYFRRAVETNPELFRGLQFAAVESLGQSQEEGFRQLEALVAAEGARFEEALEEAAAEILGQVVALQTSVREVAQNLAALRGEVGAVGVAVAGVGAGVGRAGEAAAGARAAAEGAREAAVGTRQAVETAAADTARRLDEIQAQVAQLLARLDMRNKPVEPAHSLSIRTDRDLEEVVGLIEEVEALPAAARSAHPELVTDVGKLRFAAGDFSGAGESFAAAAALAVTDADRAEAHHNAYRAKLEQEDHAGALAELRQAVALDPARFAPFPFAEYEPERILGAGGFGVTFLCRFRTNARVAVKAIESRDLDRGADAVLGEAMALDELNHPAIIRLRTCGFADEARRRRPYLVMEYFDGPTLQGYVERNGPVPPADLLPLARTLADALKAAHGHRVLHRDVKPANVMVRRRADGGWDVKLIDFGLAMKAKALAASVSTRRGATTYGRSVAGTLDYAAPEQLGRSDAPVGPPADVYGFAKTLCFALFGTTEPTLQHYRLVPESLAHLIDRCRTPNPADRPQNFGEVLAALDRIDLRDATPAGQPAGQPNQTSWAQLVERAKTALGFSGTAPQPERTREPGTTPTSRVVKVRSPGGSGVRPAADTTRAADTKTGRTRVIRKGQPNAPPADPAPGEDIPTLQPAGRGVKRAERDEPPPAPGSGDRVTHAVVAIVIGAFGIHKFMQGNTNNGILRLILGVFFWWITWIVSLVEGIQYLGMSDKEYARVYLRDKKDWF